MQHLLLSEVLTKYEQKAELLPDATYKQITVRLHGKGVVERGEVAGVEVINKPYYLAREGQFILSRIDARNGAFGLVPASLEGAIVTRDFPLFEINQSLLLPEYLLWLSRTPTFVELCQHSSEGTTNRVRLQESRFLRQSITLPSLGEQRRIVGRIEALAGKVEEARRLRETAVAETEQLLSSEEMRIWPDDSLENAPSLVSLTAYLARGRQSKQGESDHYLIKTRHVQMGQYIRSDMMLAPEIADKVLPDAIVRTGDILIACSARGSLGRVARFDTPEQLASTDTHVAIARANPDLVLPEYLYAYLKGAQGQYQLRSRERGDWTKEKVSFRLAELNLQDLRQIPVPLPSWDEQNRIINYLDRLYTKVGHVRMVQTLTQKELDALMPSILDKAFKGEL